MYRGFHVRFRLCPGLVTQRCQWAPSNIRSHQLEMALAHLALTVVQCRAEAGFSKAAPFQLLCFFRPFVFRITLLQALLLPAVQALHSACKGPFPLPSFLSLWLSGSLPGPWLQSVTPPPSIHLAPGQSLFSRLEGSCNFGLSGHLRCWNVE